MPCQKHRATTTHEDLLTPPPGALVSPMKSYRLAALRAKPFGMISFYPPGWGCFEWVGPKAK